MTAAAERDLDYGRMRLWGSVTFIAAVYGAGWLLEGNAVDHSLADGGWLLDDHHRGPFLPDIRFQAGAKDRKPVRPARPPVFLIFIVAIGLNSASFAVLYGFGSIPWRAIGLDDSQIGLLWAIGVISEIILFWFARQGRRPHRARPTDAARLCQRCPALVPDR